jgi:hypothetical protein
MKLPETGYELLSTKPLWILDDNNKPVKIENRYDTLEVFRIWDSAEIGNVLHYIDIPVERPIMFVPLLGSIFFGTYQDAERHSSSINTESGLITLIENSFETTKHNSIIVEFDEYNKVEDGLYTIAGFDEALECDDDHWLKTLRYLDKDDKCVKIKQSTEDVDFYLSKYLHMNDIETRHDVSRERLIFEIYSECGKVYINHIFINMGSKPSDVFYYTRIMNYPLFSDSKNAVAYRTAAMKYRNSVAQNVIKTEMQCNDILTKRTERDQARARRAHIIGSVKSFIWDRMDIIVDWCKKQYYKHKAKQMVDDVVDVTGTGN